MSDDKTIEDMIQDKKLNAPRLTPDMIDATIERAIFTRIQGTTLTYCTLMLKNGFTVTGESAAVSMENFDQEIGEKVSRENAREKIWALEGYLLKQRLFEQGGN